MKTHVGSTRGGRGGGRGGGGRGGGGRGGSGRGGADAGGKKAAPVAHAGKKGGREDPRFAGRKADPRFQQIAKPERDNRIRKADDERFTSKTPKFQKASVDARGRPVFHDEFTSDDDEEEEFDGASGSGEEGDEEEEEYEEGEMVAADDDIDDPDDIVEFDEGDANVETIDPTSRIAVVNCDWDHVRAVDVFAIFFHTLPLGGRVKDVKVYLSDFGKEQIERERTKGPDLWVKTGKAKEALASVQEQNAATMAMIQEEADQIELAKKARESGDADESDEGSDVDDPHMFAEVGEDGEIFSGGKFRQYELNRMKYYYAVATFDSPETASAVYDACDGMDIEASGVVLDLRYVPEDETFDASRVKSSANRIPPNFKPLKSFKQAALSQTRFRISWDQDEPHRRQALKDAFAGETEESNLAAYLASDSSGSEDEAGDLDAKQARRKQRDTKRAAIRSKYAALLEDVGGVDRVDKLPKDLANAGGSDAEDDAEDSDDDGAPRAAPAGGDDEESDGVDFDDSDDDIADKKR